MIKFRVWFLDVLGNNDDGFEVNDRSSCGHIELPENYNDHDIIQTLIDGDYLSSFIGQIKNVFNIDCQEFDIFIDSKIGRPLIQLEKE